MDRRVRVFFSLYKFFFVFNVIVLGFRCIFMKAEYSRSRSREEAMVRFCYTGIEAVVGGSGVRGS